MNFAEELAAAVPFAVPSDVADVLAAHFELLMRWNRRMNLTAIRDPQEAVRRHYAECLIFARLLRERSKDDAVLADVGSGAGFPGFVVAASWPTASVTLIESHARKAVFLSEAARPLPNVDVLAARAETVSVAADWLISRAVSPDEVMRLPYGKRVGLLIGAADVPAGWESVPVSGESRVAALSPAR